MPTMVPSRLQPILIVFTVPDAGPVARNTSSRVMTIFTGLPLFSDSFTARGSR